MKNEDFKKIIDNIQNKIGNESSGIIADDLGSLIADNLSMNNEIQEKDSLIKEKDDINNKLVSANSSLLQQVGVPQDYNKEENSEDETKISWTDCFDKKGNFLK